MMMHDCHLPTVHNQRERQYEGVIFIQAAHIEHRALIEISCYFTDFLTEFKYNSIHRLGITHIVWIFLYWLIYALKIGCIEWAIGTVPIVCTHTHTHSHQHRIKFLKNVRYWWAPTRFNKRHSVYPSLMLSNLFASCSHLFFPFFLSFSQPMHIHIPRINRVFRDFRMSYWDAFLLHPFFHCSTVYSCRPLIIANGQPDFMQEKEMRDRVRGWENMSGREKKSFTKHMQKNTDFASFNRSWSE